MAERNIPSAYGVQVLGRVARRWVTPLDGTGAMPLRLAPPRPVDWIMGAIRQKEAKKYGPGKSAILVVDLPSPSLGDFEIRELQALLLDAGGAVFREVWVTPLPGGSILIDEAQGFRWEQLMLDGRIEEARAMEGKAWRPSPTAQRILPA